MAGLTFLARPDSIRETYAAEHPSSRASAATPCPFMILTWRSVAPLIATLAGVFDWFMLGSLQLKLSVRQLDGQKLTQVTRLTWPFYYISSS